MTWFKTEFFSNKYVCMKISKGIIPWGFDEI